MDKLNIIIDIIDDKHKLAIQSHLIEEDIDVKGKKFKVEYPIVKHDVNVEYLLYRFTENDFPFFKDVTNLKKMCDYILFVQNKKQLFVFVIDLKSSNYPAQKQLNAAKEFVDFLMKSTVRVGVGINEYTVKKIRICDAKVTNKNKFIKVEDKYRFDSNNYLDYQVSKSFHIEPLL